MDSYSKKEFETMQQEAIKRVREMQKKSLSYVSQPKNDIKDEKSLHTQNTAEIKETAPDNRKADNHGRYMNYNNGSNGMPHQAQPHQNASQPSRSSQAGNNHTSNSNQPYRGVYNAYGGQGIAFNRNNHFYPYGYPHKQTNHNTVIVQKPAQSSNQPPQNADRNKNINTNQNDNQHRQYQYYYPQHNMMRNPLSQISQIFGSNLGGFSKFKQMFSLSPNKPSPKTEKPEGVTEEGDKEKKPLEGLLGGLLKDFNIDNEKIMLGILIYLLYKNGSDKKLLLALGYLLL